MIFDAHVIVVNIQNTNVRVSRRGEQYYTSVEKETPYEATTDYAKMMAVDMHAMSVERTAVLVLLDTDEYERLTSIKTNPVALLKHHSVVIQIILNNVKWAVTRYEGEYFTSMNDSPPLKASNELASKMAVALLAVWRESTVSCALQIDSLTYTALTGENVA